MAGLSSFNTGRETLLGSLLKESSIKRRVFYSFHFDGDNWRASQVRNMGVIEGNAPASDNEWEQVKRGGDEAIKRWIDGQLDGKSCTIVLIGTNTSGRKWIDYEIEKSWNDGKGVVGIHIHNLKDRYGSQSNKGLNPFSSFTMKRDDTKLSDIARTYDPAGYISTDVYKNIQLNLSKWIDEAIAIRKNY